MAWMMDTFSVSKGYTVSGVVTGKPVSLGGSLGRPYATSLGVFHTARYAMEQQGSASRAPRPPYRALATSARDAARFLDEAGVVVLAVSDRTAPSTAPVAWTSQRCGGTAQRPASVDGFPGGEAIDHAELLTLDVDLLVPAAVEGVLTADNAHAVEPASSSRGPTAPRPPTRTRSCGSAASWSCRTSLPTPAA